MPANRTFDFPVCTLHRDSMRLQPACVDTTPAVARRLTKKNHAVGQVPIVFIMHQLAA